MSSAFHKDILRSIKKGWKRFISIAIITALGVAMLVGLYASCLDMYRSADEFYDAQNLFDIRILSTLGLTEKDVAVLARIEGVEVVEGAYSETVYIYTGGIRENAQITVLSPKGLNSPYLLSGALPKRAGEVAVTEKYMEKSGKVLGDTLAIEEDLEKGKNKAASGDTDMEIEQEEETPTFPNTVYTITGVVIDPMDIQSVGGNGTNFRSKEAAEYTFFVMPRDAKNDVFTAVYLVLHGAREMDSFSDAYKDSTESVIQAIEERIKAQRELARYDDVLLEARGMIEDAEDGMHMKFAQADGEFAGAHRDIVDAGRELMDGEAALAAESQNAERKLLDARTEMETGKQKLIEAEKALMDGEAELGQKERELIVGKQRLAGERAEAEAQFYAMEQQLREAQNKLDMARIQLEPAAMLLKGFFGGAWPENQWNALVNAAAALAATGADDAAIAMGTMAESAALINALPGQVDTIVEIGLGLGKVRGGQQALDTQRSAIALRKDEAMRQILHAEAELAFGEAQIAQARHEIMVNRAEMESGKAELNAGEAALHVEEAVAREKLAAASRELADGKKELAAGEASLTEQEREYAEKRQEAWEKLADAYEELDDIDMTKWYVQDRTSLDSYSSLNNDLSSIGAVGRVFPVIFLLVAVLMSLTSMTRMVEEERGLIGAYLSQGFDNAAIYRKYFIFAGSASLLGGIVGDLLGFIGMPQFISLILKELYCLPWFSFGFDALYGFGGVLLFMVCIVGATGLACRSELREAPAALMRPKAPRAGTRVFLEYVPAIWNNLKFLNKVTARNLFRYKKRLFMTIGGIMGCTALLVCGYAIKDSLLDLPLKQYGDIAQYDVMAVWEGDENSGQIRRLAADRNVVRYLNLRVDSMKLINAGGKFERVQVMVIPEKASLWEYIHTVGQDGAPMQPDDGGILVTLNAAQLLGLKGGDTASLQNMDLVERQLGVAGVVKNYLGNNVYMTEKLYKSLFGEYMQNGVLLHLTDACADHSAYVDMLLEDDSVLSAFSTTALREDFSFDLINEVVMLVIVMAGGLAFVVLFTLSTTNISERVRELATIKVLGFYDTEVHQYVNRETLILTLAGSILGLPVGRAISGVLTIALQMPSIYFAIWIAPESYLISAVITLGFAIAVNFVTNRSLNRINMVEALKSIE